MSPSPSAAAPSGRLPANDTGPSGLLSAAELQKGESSSRTLGGNAVGLLTALAFMAFLVAYALLGQQAAGIAFWTVLLGLPALLIVVSALGAAWSRNRRAELLEIAILAVRLAEQRRAEGAGEARASMDDIAHGRVDDLPQ